MLPGRELALLADRKVALQRLLARQRQECAHYIGCVTRPLHWVDRALALSRGLGPVAFLGILTLVPLARRSVVTPLRSSTIARVWLPLLVATLRAYRALTASGRS
jgi:hypothetical protein